MKENIKRSKTKVIMPMGMKDIILRINYNTTKKFLCVALLEYLT